jgi:hypothetical protein
VIISRPMSSAVFQPGKTASIIRLERTIVVTTVRTTELESPTQKGCLAGQEDEGLINHLGASSVFSRLLESRVVSESPAPSGRPLIIGTRILGRCSLFPTSSTWLPFARLEARFKAASTSSLRPRSNVAPELRRRLSINLFPRVIQVIAPRGFAEDFFQCIVRMVGQSINNSFPLN